DCAGALGALGDAAPDGPPYVLGRFAARQLGPVRTGEPHVVAGWRLAAEGRKLLAGSALFTVTGGAVGVARAAGVRLGWLMRRPAAARSARCARSRAARRRCLSPPARARRGP